MVELLSTSSCTSVPRGTPGKSSRDKMQSWTQIKPVLSKFTSKTMKRLITPDCHLEFISFGPLLCASYTPPKTLFLRDWNGISLVYLSNVLPFKFTWHIPTKLVRIVDLFEANTTKLPMVLYEWFRTQEDILKLPITKLKCTISLACFSN